MTKFKVGDKVIYRGEQSVIVTTDKKYCKQSDCIIEYSNGWYRGYSVPSDYIYTKYDTYYFASFKDLELVEKQPTYKFKVGDKVVGNELARANYTITTEGYIGTVTKVFTHLEVDGFCVDEECFDLVEEESLLGACGSSSVLTAAEVFSSFASRSYTSTIISGSVGKDLSIKSGKTIMSILTTFVKNSLLSADEKALRQVGLKTDCGEYTQEAIDLVLQELCKEKEARLIEVANGLLAEDKKNK